MDGAEDCRQPCLRIVLAKVRNGAAIPLSCPKTGGCTMSSKLPLALIVIAALVVCGVAQSQVPPPSKPDTLKDPELKDLVRVLREAKDAVRQTLLAGLEPSGANRWVWVPTFGDGTPGRSVRSSPKDGDPKGGEFVVGEADALARLLNVYPVASIDRAMIAVNENIRKAIEHTNSIRVDVLKTVKELRSQESLENYWLAVLQKKVLTDEKLRAKLVESLRTELRTDKVFRDLLLKDLAAELKNKSAN